MSAICDSAQQVAPSPSMPKPEKRGVCCSLLLYWQVLDLKLFALMIPVSISVVLAKMVAIPQHVPSAVGLGLQPFQDNAGGRKYLLQNNKRELDVQPWQPF